MERLVCRAPRQDGKSTPGPPFGVPHCPKTTRGLPFIADILRIPGVLGTMTPSWTHSSSAIPEHTCSVPYGFWQFDRFAGEYRSPFGDGVRYAPQCELLNRQLLRGQRMVRRRPSLRCGFGVAMALFLGLSMANGTAQAQSA